MYIYKYINTQFNIKYIKYLYFENSKNFTISNIIFESPYYREITES